jgi:hypothetical protein
MRIFVICDVLEKERINQLLFKNNVASVPNILFAHDFEKAQNFIDQHLEDESGHADLVIVTNSVKHDAVDEHLIDRLRSSVSSYCRKGYS